GLGLGLVIVDISVSAVTAAYGLPGKACAARRQVTKRFNPLTYGLPMGQIKIKSQIKSKAKPNA
ncbi:hypothetical protein, partial [Pseudomonas fluorescens]|uniref:hypothetical protein n=1 Tax=Pseudomonas fluorescens TaxID=294 RepID=UPI001A9148CB